MRVWSACTRPESRGGAAQLGPHLDKSRVPPLGSLCHPHLRLQRLLPPTQLLLPFRAAVIPGRVLRGSGPASVGLGGGRCPRGGGGGGAASRSGGRGGRRRCGRGAPRVRPPRSAPPGADASAPGAGAEPPPPARRRGPGAGRARAPSPLPARDARLSRPGRDRCAHGAPPPRPRPPALALPPAHSRRGGSEVSAPGRLREGAGGGAVPGCLSARSWGAGSSAGAAR